MSARFFMPLIAAYALAGVVAWGHFIERGCMPDDAGKCRTATWRAVPGMFIWAGWPVYTSAVYFERDKP